MTPPALFDADLLALRRARAARLGPADFLQEAVAAEVAERLTEVNRSFRAPAIIGPRAGLWAAALGLPDARRVPDADILDLEPAAHDLVVHALALHWANDPVGQLVQARRALRPDGLFLAALFGGETLTELRAALAEAEIETLGGLSPRVAPMGEIRDLGGLLQRAGFALPVADSRRYEVSYPSALALMHDLRAMGETNVQHDRLRRADPPVPAGTRRRHLRRPIRRRQRPGPRDLRGDLPDRLGAGPRPAEAAAPRLRRRAPRRRPRRGRTLGRRARDPEPTRQGMKQPRDLTPGADRLAHAPAGHPPVPPARVGVILANLGTPDATDYWSMRRYLREFLSDRRVIDYPAWKWQPLLHLVVLSRRPFTSGANYRRIWDTEADDSPLRVITRDQADGGGGPPRRPLRRPRPPSTSPCATATPRHPR